MAGLVTRRLPGEVDAIAPDGSEIRFMAATDRGSMAHCTLRPGGVARAVRHRTVTELWYCVAGRGRLWRALGSTEEVIDLEPGTSVNIPLGARFQFRAAGESALRIVIVTMPPWPGDDEAVPCAGKWAPTVRAL